ncbi:TetR/AcrR family transcriptional regulator [Lentibacter algarum]|uniref:TetR/AcrR family transcriptional regulator n=1 Tax=Lentibacter algarum TaxID=576131 RepID=UPI001C099314|nr:TetR/AcrR family transcriptional regulator [Lentibacter algarum]MBU2983004.1 TetR/AcrR family transcriptional regulator [Lentibacter algarum]
MSDKQLSKNDWIAAGFEALAKQGPQALKAEALARALGTTKGSFYWHFKDVAAFHDSMINKWQNSATVITDEENPATTLRNLAQNYAVMADPNLRAWARSNEQVAQALADSDTRKLTEIASLLEKCGVSNPELAQVLFAATIGLTETPGCDAKNAIATLVDLILALR